MRETEQTAKNVEEAVQQGLQILGVAREDVEIHILEEPAGGIFGFGAKQAKVRIVVKEANVEKAQAVLQDVLRILNLDGTVDVVKNDDNSFRFEISGEDLGILIGHRGQTLNALQFFVGLVLGRGMEGRKVSCTLDIEGYRARRERSLQILAEKMAQRASTERRNIVLEPMLPHERRIIHLALQNNPYVTTTSQGKEPMRKVVISPKEGGKTAGKDRRRPANTYSKSSGRTRSTSGNYSYRGSTRSASSRPAQFHHGPDSGP